MRNFLRAVKNSWPFRTRLILSIACALCAAVFWSLSFLAIHPAMKILGGVTSLPDSVEADIKQIEHEMEGLQYTLQTRREELKSIQDDPAKEDRKGIDLGVIAQTEWKIQQANLSIYRLQLLKSFYLRMVPSDPFRALVFLLAMVVVTMAIKGLFEFGQDTLVGSVTNLTLYSLRNRFYRNSVRLDVNKFGAAGSHELMARFTNDMETLGAGLKTLYGKVVAEPLKGIACLSLACMISWQLTLLFLVLVPLWALIMLKVGRVMKRASKRVLERMTDMFKILQETFQGIRVVKGFTMEPYERRRFRNATREYYRKSMRLVTLDAIADPMTEVLGICGIVLALLVGAYLVLTQKTDVFGIRMTSYPMDPETLLMYYALVAAVADPVRRLSSVYTKLQSSAAAADRIFALMDREPRVHRNCQSPPLPRHSESIEFRDICFSYEPDRPVLTNVNLTFKFGETVALVGRNGCGKTTLLGLLPRFYDPDHGSISIDGVDIRGINLRSLRKQIAVVQQEIVLFDDTVLSNIAYGRRRAGRDEVEAAARRAFVHEIIERLPRGYDTRIGEAGHSLSGGEKQRIALARAILRDPRILILDEFTSQIDAESEGKIHHALREFIKGRTTFVITHRLHTLEIADRIVVIDRGRIETVGTHAELLVKSPVYQSLYEAHFQRRAA
jgi:ATP-binding cassette subfamily B protein/subfamily B ATP-binding cassette protein MsbA